MKFYPCPFCGPRPQAEFQFRKTVDLESKTEFDATYLRSHDLKTSHEHWQHLSGCGAWLTLQRNPSTGDVVAIDLMRKVSK